MIFFKDFILKENEFFKKLEEDVEVESIIEDAIRHAFYNIDRGLEIRDYETFSDIFRKNLSVDETDMLSLSLDKELDLCMYAEDRDGEKCPSISFDQLSMIISKRALDAIRYMLSDKGEKVVKILEVVIDTYDLHDFKYYREDPYSHFSPKNISQSGNFSIYHYRKLDNDSNSNYDVYHYHNSESMIPDFYLVSKV